MVGLVCLFTKKKTANPHGPKLPSHCSRWNNSEKRERIIQKINGLIVWSQDLNSRSPSLIS
jgi:hypothetical protein